MASKPGPDPIKVHNDYLKAIAGMEQDWPNNQPTIVLQGVSYTSAQFLAKLEEMDGPFQAVADAHSALRTALAVRSDVLPDAAEFIRDFYSVLAQYLPKGSAAVTKFGAKTKKQRAALSVEAKVSANAKRQATRAARHIMGKKQRSAIKAPAPLPAAQPKTGS
jgi:hypothetical protein